MRNLKQHQGKLMIFAMGFCGFTLLGMNPIASIFWSILTQILSAIFYAVWKKLSGYAITYDQNAKRFVLLEIDK